MDTATHLVVGVTIGSLAKLDPAIAQRDIGPQAVMLAT
ncbi:metal-dependent hydrolase, partial [Bacillus tropicus]|nr:metal-dependent hydrolase [Bacillus tropicus]